MSWSDVLAILRAECGDDQADRIAKRLYREFGGCRLTVPKRQPIDREMIDAAAPGRPRDAARKLGVHHTTVYRVLRRRVVR